MTRKDFVDIAEDEGNDWAFEELMLTDSRVKFVGDLGDKFGDLSESNYWFYDGKNNPVPLWGADDAEECGLFGEQDSLIQAKEIRLWEK